MKINTEFGGSHAQRRPIHPLLLFCLLDSPPLPVWNERSSLYLLVIESTLPSLPPPNNLTEIHHFSRSRLSSWSSSAMLGDDLIFGGVAKIGQPCNGR